MAELFAPVCSICATERRRYFWAAWWSAPPERDPFQKPDAASGGARTREEAKRVAEAAAGGVPLVDIEPLYAKAWLRITRGLPPWPTRHAERNEGNASRLPRVHGEATDASIWQTLGLSPHATLAEIKAAYRTRAKETHPDRGGSTDAFRAVQRAYEIAVARRERDAKKPKPKRR